MTPPTEAAHRALPRVIALERVSSPEQLDQLLTLTTARSWIALVAVAALIAVGVGWSFVGRLYTYVEGDGVFLREGGSIASAAATGSGTLLRVLVEKGDHVNAGQVIAQIAAPDVEQQITSLRGLVAEREDELQRQRDSTAREIEANRIALNQRETALVQIQFDGRRRVEALRRSLSDQQELFNAQIVTRSAVLQAQAQVDQAMQEVASTADQITQLDIQLRDLVFKGDQRVKNSEFALTEARRQLVERLETYRMGTEVHSPVAGTVNEIQLRAGSLVGRGQSVLTIEAAARGLEFVLFASLLDGNQIQPGQSVKVSPNWTVREEEGTMLGDVIEASKLPITPEALRSLLHNEDLVRHFSNGGPVFIVHVRLKRDPTNRSGYAWTSSKGAEIPVDSGGFGRGEVLVKSQRPISLAIPALRRWTGI